MLLKSFLQTRTGTYLELFIFYAVTLSTLQVGIVIPVLIALTIGSLKIREKEYSEIGFIKSDFKLKNILAGIALAMFYFILFHFFIDPLLSRITNGSLPSVFNIKGNIKALILWMILSWTIAAFGEEIIFRGYLINRLNDLIGNSYGGKFLIVILAGTAFGFAHFYQGIYGVISAGLFGMFQSVVFLLRGKKLAIPVIAHGAYDTIGFISLFIG